MKKIMILLRKIQMSKIHKENKRMMKRMKMMMTKMKQMMINLFIKKGDVILYQNLLL